MNEFSKDIIKDLSGTPKPGRHIDFHFADENEIVQGEKILRNVFFNIKRYVDLVEGTIDFVTNSARALHLPLFLPQII